MLASQGTGDGSLTASPDLPEPLAVALEEGVKSKFGGEVVVRSGDKKGRVYLYGGRVAWVTCDTISARLGDALRAYVNIPDDELRAAVVEGRRVGKGFGEVLVEWNLVEDETLRKALLEHNAAHFRGLLALGSQLQALFLPQARTYSGKLLFTLQELLDASSVERPAPATESSGTELEPAPQFVPVDEGSLEAALERVPSATMVFVVRGNEAQVAKTADHPGADTKSAVQSFIDQTLKVRSAPLAKDAPEELVMIESQSLIVLLRQESVAVGMICEEAHTIGMALGMARSVLRGLAESSAG
ncbi:MAG: hypothetical protein AAFQ82_02870 [Myxococcota bacterium]